MVKYIVHNVEPMHDTLFKLSFYYKVSQKEIRRINEIEGDDIYFLKKILIPVKNGNDEAELPAITEEERSKDEKVRRETAVKLMKEAILKTEKKYAKELKLLKDELRKIDYTNEAEYYLRENSYDFRKAFKMFEDEVRFEI